MKLENEWCTVQITIDTAYTLQSPHNMHYDFELNPENYTADDDFYKTLSILVSLFNKEYDIALVGDHHSYDTDCALLDGPVLTVMQNDTISQIDIRNGELVLHKSFDCYGLAWGIFRVPNGFIVWGEIEILRLDLNFDKVWGFEGRDVFFSSSHKKAFELSDTSIKLYDFLDNYYELDFDGNLLFERPAN